MTRFDEAFAQHHWNGLDFMDGRQVTISRDLGPQGVSTVCVQAIKASRSSDLTDAEAAYLTEESQDWLIRACDYQLGGGQTLPAAQDEIKWRDQKGNIATYQVGVDGLERQYRFTDGTEQILRVHSTQV